MTELETPLLSVDAVDAITALCNRSLPRPLLRTELERSLFAPDQPTVVRGDPGVGVVVTVPGTPEGFIRLLVVDPDHRRHGHGHTLLAAAEADLEASTVITVGADAPYYLFAGVETSEIEMLCLLEGHGYHREDANLNMAIDFARLPPDPGTGAIATPADRDEVATWMEEHWAHWKAEVLKALDNATLLLNRDEQGIAAFCAWDVNRAGLLGPVASRPDLIGKGRSRPILLGALHRMGPGTAAAPTEISWVGPIGPYAAVGGSITRVFIVHRKRRKRPA